MCVSGTTAFTYRITTQFVLFFDYITQKRRKYSPKVLLTDASDSQDLYRHDNLPFSFTLLVKSFHQ